MKAEQPIQSEIMKYLKRTGCYGRKLIAIQTGTPDVIACCKGQFIGIEVKKEGENPTPIQKLNIKLIKQAGGIAFVARSVKDVKEVCEENDTNLPTDMKRLIIEGLSKPMSATEFAFDELTKMRKDKIINMDTQIFSSDDTLTLMTKFARYLGCKSANKY